MSYLGKDFDKMMGCMMVLAVIGFLAVVFGGIFGITWLLNHVRFA